MKRADRGIHDSLGWRTILGASDGEQVITRANNRTRRMTATDWVENGDRWTELKGSRSRDLTVRHNRNGRTVRLPMFRCLLVDDAHVAAIRTCRVDTRWNSRLSLSAIKPTRRMHPQNTRAELNAARRAPSLS